MLKEIYKKRPEWSKKGDFGKILVIGGSNMYTGAPAFSGLAALKSGADIAMIVAPKRAADIIASYSPDLITKPIEGDHFHKRHLKDILAFSKQFDSVVIGPGLGRNPDTKKAVVEFIKNCGLPIVIDGDAIHAVAGDKSSLTKRADLPTIITPHSTEFIILSNAEIKDLKSRKHEAKVFAKKFDVTILLKGYVDIITNGKEIFENRTGNPYMTVGGTGDTLTGICGALLARGVNEITSAKAGAYLNGRAGDLAAKEYGEGLTASKIIEFLPKAIK